MHSMSDEPETDTDAYRPSEATRLRTTITDHREGLAICGISGAGGIGKSYLVEHVLSSLDTAKSGWLAYASVHSLGDAEKKCAPPVYKRHTGVASAS